MTHLCSLSFVKHLSLTIKSCDETCGKNCLVIFKLEKSLIDAALDTVSSMPGLLYMDELNNKRRH